MTQLELFIPGLLTPLRGGERQHPFEGVAEETLWRAFRRATVTHAAAVETLWAARCGAAAFPWAAAYAQAANLNVPEPGLPTRGASDAHWLCADPLQIRVEHRGLFAMGHPQPALSEPERNTLLTDLNAWLQQDAYALHAPAQSPWLLCMPVAPAWQGAPLADIIGVDLAHLLPRTPEGLRWQSRLMEWQMLLQNHPVNVSRRAQGQGEISSLWLSGAGTLSDVVWPGYSQVITDNTAIAAWARLHNASVTTPDAWRPAEKSARSLVFLSALALPFAHGQRAAWQTAYQCYRPFFEMLAANRSTFDTLCLHPDDGFSYSLTKRDAWKFWRNAPLRARHVQSAEA